MKKLFAAFFYIMILLIIVSFAMGASFVLPYPWSKVNILFAFLLLILAFRPQGTVVWMSFIAHFFLELYAITPFGILLVSGTLSMLFTFWAYQYLFSNRSWYAMVAMCAFTLGIYRCIYVITLYIAHLIHPETVISWGSIMETTAWEILFTTTLVAVLYLIFFYRSRRPVIMSMYGR